jgi:hypothetical protein
MLCWDSIQNYTLASEGRGNSGLCHGACWELLLMDRDHRQGRAPFQRVGGWAASSALVVCMSLFARFGINHFLAVCLFPQACFLWAVPPCCTLEEA